MIKRFFYFIVGMLLFAGCTKTPEMTLAEIAELTAAGDSVLVNKTVSRPWTGEKPVPGKIGGVWQTTILSDPKTFNQIIAERDGSSSELISKTLDYLVYYDAVLRKWEPRLAYFEIETDEKADTLTVHYTLREGLFWSWYGSDRKVPVTSDDFVFWYNEIAGDEAFQSSGYAQQWCTMPDGSSSHIDCVKIDDRRFDFVFPRIVAEPLLATNMSLCPSFIYKEAKEKGGVEGVKNLFSINCNVREIPSCGEWYLTDYAPSQRLIYRRNPNFWEKDSEGTSIPYVEQMVCQIVGDMNTEFLLFKQGKVETFSPRPEELSDIVENQKDDYTVFNAEGSLGALLWSFNQNPKNKETDFYRWFCIKQFRQAMSCLLNRERIIDQTYRGLAMPKYDFFPDANPMYNPDITLQYRFAPERAVKLLESAGFYRDSDGIMHDASGVPVEYDLTVATTNNLMNDMAMIISDECSKVGIKVNVRQLDFQKMIEMLTATYDWQSIMIGLGSNFFPSQGSNVWPSYGNLHLWNPLQEKPATEWEARIDYLYNEGNFTIDKNEAKKIWDEYQRILLEECPVIYLLRSRSFFAIRNRWNLTNVYFDNKSGAKTEYVWLSDQ